MRILLVAIIWLVVLGGLQAFVNVRHDPAHRSSEATFEEAEGKFTLEISASFTGEKDPFALDIGEDESVALRVLLLGEEVFAGEDFKANEPFIVEDVKGLIEGENEFFVEAAPPAGTYNQVHALRLRVLRDGAPIDEFTFWSEQGEKIAGACRLDLTHHGGGDEHEH